MNAFATPPSTSLDLVPGEPSLTTNDDGAQVLNLPFTVVDEPGTTIDVKYFREEFTETGSEQTLVFSSRIVFAEPLSLDLELPADHSGEYGVRLILTKIKDDIPTEGSVTYQRYYRIGADGQYKEYSLLEFTQLKANERRDLPGHLGLRATHPHGVYDPTLDINTDDVSKDNLTLSKPGLNIGAIQMEVLKGEPDEAEGKPAYVTLKGTLSTTINGNSVPLNFTRIEFWDKDPVNDDYLGTTRTDEDGNYVIVVNNDDGPFGGGVDVYLYIYTNQSDVTLLYLVPDGDGGYQPFYYSWKSATHDNLDQKVVTIDYNISQNNLASTVWAGADAASNFVTSTTGRNLSHVEVRYPPFKPGTYYLNGIINIDPKNGDSPDTVGHEYGHAVMDQAYGGFPEGSGGAHSLCEAANPGLSWSEGFATWYGLAAWGDSPDMTWSIGGPSVSIETWHCGPLDATKDEGRSAAWIWDLYDLPTDSNGGDTAYGRNGYRDSNGGDSLVGSRTLLNTLWLGKQNDTSAYWTALQGELTTAQKEPSNQISNYNYLIE